MHEFYFYSAFVKTKLKICAFSEIAIYPVTNNQNM